MVLHILNTLVTTVTFDFHVIMPEKPCVAKCAIFHVLPFSTVCVDTASRRFSSCGKVDPSRQFGSSSKVDRSSSLSVTLPPTLRHSWQMLSKSAHICSTNWLISSRDKLSFERFSQWCLTRLGGGGNWASFFMLTHLAVSLHLLHGCWFLPPLLLLDLGHTLVFYLQRTLWTTVTSSLLSPISSLRFCQQHLLSWTVVDTSLNSAACHEVESQLVSSSAELQRVCFWRIPWWMS